MVGDSILQTDAQSTYLTIKIQHVSGAQWTQQVVITTDSQYVLDIMAPLGQCRFVADGL